MGAPNEQQSPNNSFHSVFCILSIFIGLSVENVFVQGCLIWIQHAMCVEHVKCIRIVSRANNRNETHESNFIEFSLGKFLYHSIRQLNDERFDNSKISRKLFRHSCWITDINPQSTLCHCIIPLSIDDFFRNYRTSARCSLGDIARHADKHSGAGVFVFVCEGACMCVPSRDKFCANLCF